MITLPIAMGIFYPLANISIPPSLAGLAELLSSLPVIMFSLMLRFYKPSILVELKSAPHMSKIETELEMTQPLDSIRVQPQEQIHSNLD
jgi:Cu+-exporting ATPase